MTEAALRLLWFAIVTTALSYGSFLVVGQTVHSNASGAKQPIIVVDNLKPGVHTLTGTVTVPSNCHELHVDIKKTGDNVYTLKFETWEEPSIRCTADPVPRPFGAIAFAPAVGVRFDAMLDGVPIPIVVRPKVVWERSTTTNAIELHTAQ